MPRSTTLVSRPLFLASIHVYPCVKIDPHLLLARGCPFYDSKWRGIPLKNCHFNEGHVFQGFSTLFLFAGSQSHHGPFTHEHPWLELCGVPPCQPTDQNWTCFPRHEPKRADSPKWIHMAGILGIADPMLFGWLKSHLKQFQVQMSDNTLSVEHLQSGWVAMIH